MRKYPKLRYPSHDEASGLLDSGRLVVLEKLDGANFRFTYDAEEGKMLYGTRNHEYYEDDENLPKVFSHAVEYIENTERHDVSEYPTLEFFGEAMHEHSLPYDAWEGDFPDPSLKRPPNVVIFDIWDEEEGEWLSWEEVEVLATNIGMETAPVIEKVSVDEFDGVDIPPSAFRESQPDADSDFERRGLAEGVVLRNDATGVRAKVVADEFKERRSGPSGSTDEATSEAGLFVQQYVTGARIEKQAHKLVDEGEYDGLCMEMMEVLPRRVGEDVMAEAGWEVLCGGVELTEEAKAAIRSKLSQKCVRVLRNELQSVVR